MLHRPSLRLICGAKPHWVSIRVIIVNFLCLCTNMRGRRKIAKGLRHRKELYDHLVSSDLWQWPLWGTEMDLIPGVLKADYNRVCHRYWSDFQFTPIHSGKNCFNFENEVQRQIKTFKSKTPTGTSPCQIIGLGVS